MKQVGTVTNVVIIGSGSGAFACAIKAAEGGAKVTMIESAEVIGGCCVNVGCVFVHAPACGASLCFCSDAPR